MFGSQDLMIALNKTPDQNLLNSIMIKHNVRCSLAMLLCLLQSVCAWLISYFFGVGIDCLMEHCRPRKQIAELHLVSTFVRSFKRVTLLKVSSSLSLRNASRIHLWKTYFFVHRTVVSRRCLTSFVWYAIFEACLSWMNLILTFYSNMFVCSGWLIYFCGLIVMEMDSLTWISSRKSWRN